MGLRSSYEGAADAVLGIFASEPDVSAAISA
jgi:hypothetical protein